MTRPILLTLTLLALAAGAGAQTTGTPGFNDLTINGFGSGSTSCSLFAFPPPGVLTFSISAQFSGSTVYFLFSDAPCTPGVAGPFCGTTFDIGLTASSTLVVFPTATGPGGVTSIAVPVPPLVSGTLSTQALILDPTCPTFVLMTQAYTVKVGC